MTKTEQQKVDEKEAEKDQAPEEAPQPELKPVVTTVIEPEQAPALLTLTIGDLNEIVKIIDAVAERGAFKGSEMHGIGRLRDHLVNYINQQLPPE